MTRMGWQLEELPWESFDPSKVDGDLLKVVKAASLVEYNGADYATYLCNVFSHDPDLCDAIQEWGAEEEQHGEKRLIAEAETSPTAEIWYHTAPSAPKRRCSTLPTCHLPDVSRQ